MLSILFSSTTSYFYPAKIEKKNETNRQTKSEILRCETEVVMPFARTEAIDRRDEEKWGYKGWRNPCRKGGDTVKIASISDFSESWHIDKNTKWFNFSSPIHLSWKVFLAQENPKEFWHLWSTGIDLKSTKLLGSTPIETEWEAKYYIALMI